MRQAALSALPEMEVAKLIDGQTLAAVSKAFDTSHITAALTHTPAFAQLQESMRQAALSALPKIEVAKLIDGQTLAAVSKAFDTSHITAALTDSPALRELAEAFNQHVLLRTAVAPMVSSTITMQGIFTELSAVSTSLLADFDVDQDRQIDVETPSEVPDTRLIAQQAMSLLVVVLAATVATVPGAEELAVSVGRELLEESVFLGQATYDAYAELSEVLPDDNVLGWAAMLAWLLRWLKGPTGGDTDERSRP